MAVKYGFFNSVNGDRVYDANDLSSMFEGLITDGVFEGLGDDLETTPGTGMKVVVGVGKAWFNNTWTTNDANLPLTIDPSDLVFARIDVVVLECNRSNAVRANSIKIIKGIPSSNPQPPTLTTTVDVDYHPLAYVTVPAGASSIVSGNIEVLVGTGYCQYITVPKAGVGNVAGVLQMQIFS